MEPARALNKKMLEKEVCWCLGKQTDPTCEQNRWKTESNVADSVINTGVTILCSTQEWIKATIKRTKDQSDDPGFFTDEHGTQSAIFALFHTRLYHFFWQAR